MPETMREPPRRFAWLVLAAACALPACAEAKAPTAPVAPEATAASAVASPAPAPTAAPPATDALATPEGELRITPIHHATLAIGWGTKTIWVDPWSEGRLDAAPKADLILITDVHQDHFDPKAIEAVRQPGTVIVAPPVVAAKLPGAIALENGARTTAVGVPIEAVAMYNLVRGPSAGQLFHDKGRGNGYVLTLGGKRIYIAGDTECTPEMRALAGIDVAFVPMNLPYTMTPDEAAGCVKAFRPHIVYPFHHRGSDPGIFVRALEGEPGIEVRVRSWY